MTEKIKRIMKQNSSILYIVIIISLCLVMVVFLAIVKSKNKDNNLKDPNVLEVDGDLSDYAIEKQWVIDTWSPNKDSFSYYFKYDMLDYSAFDTPKRNYVVACFYGDDNSKFAFSFYNSPDSKTRLGSDILLQVAPDKVDEITEWRNKKTSVAQETINGFDQTFYYYYILDDELDFSTNKIKNTSISINLNSAYYNENLGETNFKYLTKNRPGQKYILDYGIKGEFLENMLAKGSTDINVDEESIKRNGFDVLNLYQEYYVLPIDVYNEFMNLSDDKKIKYIEKNKLIDTKNSECPSKIVKMNVGYISYDGSNWYYRIDNEKSIEELGKDFMRSAGSTGSSIKPEGNPVTINAILEYDGYTNLEQAKEFTEFVERKINKSPDLFA